MWIFEETPGSREGCPFGGVRGRRFGPADLPGYCRDLQVLVGETRKNQPYLHGLYMVYKWCIHV